MLPAPSPTHCLSLEHPQARLWESPFQRSTSWDPTSTEKVGLSAVGVGGTNPLKPSGLGGSLCAIPWGGGVWPRPHSHFGSYAWGLVGKITLAVPQEVHKRGC